SLSHLFCVEVRISPLIRWPNLLCHYSMVLAVADTLNRSGYPAYRRMWVSATDIDPLAAGMAYIQLSLCGVAGEVVIGNSLCNERRRVLLTPGHYLGNWSYRLRHSQKQTAA
ncbi:hypothetical protein ACUBGW_27175, partial [Escherichia coli]|nr:hypothetical protein [Escherichia coli]MCK3083638.1 hypothetical protein [Escherichia coli]